MSEPRRLREVSGSAVEHALLSAGASYRSSPDAHTKTLTALGLASSAALTAGVAGATTTTSLVSKLGWTKLISMLSVGAAVIVPAGYLALRQSSSGVESAAAPAVRPAPVARVETAAGATPREAPRAEVPVQSANSLESAKAVPAARILKPEASSRVDSVAAELGAIDGVRAALARGDASGALSRLDGYAKAYPRGRLAVEAEVLRIDALARSGQGAVASKRAEAFLRRFPNSVFASRVRGYVKQ